MICNARTSRFNRRLQMEVELNTHKIQSLLTQTTAKTTYSGRNNKDDTMWKFNFNYEKVLASNENNNAIVIATNSEKDAPMHMITTNCILAANAATQIKIEGK